MKERLSELYLLSPANGQVNKVNIGVAGMVVKSGDAILELVPDTSKLRAELSIPPESRGQIEAGQPVRLKFSSYNFSRHGGLEGRIVSITPMTIPDQQGKPFYIAEVSVPKNYLGEDKNKNPIVIGMTVDAEIITGQKTILEYLFKPVVLSAKKALHEK